MSALSQRELKEIAARADAAAPGPWTCRTFGNRGMVTYRWSGGVRALDDYISAENARFVAAAREDVPNLVAEVERLRALLAKEKARAVSRNNESKAARSGGREKE
jgi:hypothetical protein